MTVQTEDKTGSRGWWKRWSGAKQNVQSRVEEAHRIWNETFEQIHARLHEADKNVRDMVRRIEEDGRSRLDALRDQLKVDEMVQRLRTGEWREQGARMTHETMERLGLASYEDVENLRTEVDKLAKKVETVRKRASESARTKEVKALERRVEELERKLAETRG